MLPKRMCFRVIAVSILLISFGAVRHSDAQSLDARFPTPIRTNSLVGKIAARDLGDARLTDHFYAFSGTPGDLMITVNSQNLNGDIDVFTAGTLKPLLKLTLYAESSAPVTKGIYLRRHEDLVLRVEARSPNDDEGSYQLSFSGSFEPIIGGRDIADTEPATTSNTNSSGGNKTRRVSSVGARIEQPAEEVAATPTPEPTPEPKPEPPPQPTTATTTKTKTNKPATTNRGTTSKRATARHTPTVTPTPKEPASETKPATTTEAETSTETAEVAPKPKPKTTASKPSSTRTAKPTVSQPPPEPVPDTGPKLIIETNDGTLINRSMSGVRRVMVENGQVIVVGKDGKVARFLLVNVVRMSIAP